MNTLHPSRALDDAHAASAHSPAQTLTFISLTGKIVNFTSSTGAERDTGRHQGES